MQGFASLQTQEHLWGWVLMVGDEVWLTQLSKLIPEVFSGIVSHFVKATQVFPSTFLCTQWQEQINIFIQMETFFLWRLHGCILVFINFIVTSAAEIATLVNWKWVSTCLWPCCVLYIRTTKGEFSYLNLMICLMQSMPFHRSASALALQHKHVNVDLSPRCPTESKFSTFCVFCCCCFCIAFALSLS